MEDLIFKSVSEKTKVIEFKGPLGECNPVLGRSIMDMEVVAEYIEKFDIEAIKCNITAIDKGLQITDDGEGVFITEFVIFQKREGEHDLSDYLRI